MLHGARQVGKTYAVRELGKTFPSFVEINFELTKKITSIFTYDLNPHRIIQELSIITEQTIIPGQTLLFFDEVQSVPEAILALRYFYEMMPELHVIAAGSLLDFAIEQVGIPVGRVEFLYLYPMSFIEFLAALNQHLAIKEIIDHDPQTPMPDVIHEKFFHLLGQYLAIGGMPQAVACWQQLTNLQTCASIPQTLCAAYQYDFVKYGKSHQIKYLDLLFSRIPYQLGKKFKYSEIGEFRKRELEPCLDLLATAGIIHRVMHSSGQGIPLGAQADPQTFKIILLDVGLTQFMLDLKPGSWLLNPLDEFVNKGMLVESFVGQELLAYEHPAKKGSLHYWKQEKPTSNAEIDYLIQINNAIIPIKAKSGTGRTLKSMHLFLQQHPNSPYGIRTSTNNYSVHEVIHSYPLYALAGINARHDAQVRMAMLSLV